MKHLLNTIFSNNTNLSTMNNQIQKEENPLFPIARTKHSEAFNTGDFVFLINTLPNENTFILGFCEGAGHAAGVFKKQIEEMQSKLSELNKLSMENETLLKNKIANLERQIAAPTLHRQN